MTSLHRDVSAAFLLHTISPLIAILFSISQGDPLASLLFILWIKPFLVRLEASLFGLQMARSKRTHLDDVEVLGSHLSDIIKVDSITLSFEVAAKAILNPNRKTLILDLGS